MKIRAKVPTPSATAALARLRCTIGSPPSRGSTEPLRERSLPLYCGKVLASGHSSQRSHEVGSWSSRGTNGMRMPRIGGARNYRARRRGSEGLQLSPEAHSADGEVIQFPGER